MSGRLDGKVALVTGGGTGIGRASSLRLAAEGAAVAINYSRSETDAEATAAEIREAGGRAITLQADVSSDPAVAAMVERVTKEWGRLDVLVNNAGMTYFVEHTDLDGLTEAMWDRMLAVNLKGVFFCCRAAARVMRRQRSGRIITVASIASHVGSRYTAAYTASKHAALGFIRALAAEVAGTGVTANAVCPAYVDTPMTDDTVRRMGEKTGIEEGAARELLAGMVPLGRLLTPAEVAHAVAFLAHPDSGAINGQSIVLDGGGLQA